MRKLAQHHQEDDENAVVFTRRETAAKLKVGLSMVDRLVGDGVLDFIRIGRHVRITGRSIDDVIAGRRKVAK